MASRIPSPSAFGLLFVFGLTAYGGANILTFQGLEHRIWFGAAGQPIKSVLDDVSPWTNTSGVAAVARSLMLEVILLETPDDKAAIESALNELAAAAPTSTATWQSLAEVRKARRAPMESVLAAFRMSALTGSHEGYFMMRRAVFGLEHWSELPEMDRRTVVRDLLASFGPEHGAQTRYRKILAAKSETERDSIRAAMLASGLATNDVLQGLGV